jgi:hypothetical protein
MTYLYSAHYITTTSEVLGYKTTTYIYEVSTFTGGAHGSTYNITITTKDDGTVIPNEQILTNKDLEHISGQVYEKVISEKKSRLAEWFTTKKEEADYFASGETTNWIKEGTAPNRDNYKAIGLDGDNLVIYLGQYQVGPYAEGMYTITIPFQKVK